MSSVNDFVSNFQIGARSNLYKVQVDGLSEKLTFTCKVAQIPGKTVNPIEVRYLNNVIKVAGDTTFDPMTLTVLNDEDFVIRKQLEEWQEGIKNNAQAVGDGQLSDYFRTATIIQLNRDGSENADAKYKLINCWPSAIDPIELGFDNADTIEEYGFTLEYSHFEKE